jgi:hypothetical protein
MIQLAVHVIELKHQPVLFSAIHTRSIRQDVQGERVIANIGGRSKGGSS